MILKNKNLLFSFYERLTLHLLLLFYILTNNRLKSLEIFERITGRYGEKFPSIYYNYISRVYKNKADYQKADYYINKYLDTHKKSKKAIYYRLKVQYKWAREAKYYRLLYPSSDYSENILNAPAWNIVAGLYSNSSPSIKKTGKDAFIQELIHSSVFLAEELREKNDVHGVISAYRNAFSGQGLSLTGGFVEYFLLTLEEYFFKKMSGINLQKILIEKINAVGHGILSYNAWITIYYILIYNGLFKIGLAARNKAIEQSFLEAEAEPGNSNKLRRATVAALDNSDFIHAEKYIASLKGKGSRKEYSALNAYYHLLKGDVEKARGLWENNLTKLDKSSAEYFKDKTVAIVGPAPNGIYSGKEIDSYDIVIRFNYAGSKSLHNADEFGRKINLTLYAPMVINMRSFDDLEFINDLDFYIVKNKASLFGSDDIKKGRARTLLRNKLFFLKTPNAVPCMLFHLFHYETKKIKVFKSNFFLSENPYADNYSGSGNSSKKLQLPLLNNHDLVSQRSFVKILWERGLIEIDENCSEVLSLSDEEYMEGIEKLI